MEETRRAAMGKGHGLPCPPRWTPLAADVQGRSQSSVVKVSCGGLVTQVSSVKPSAPGAVCTQPPGPWGWTSQLCDPLAPGPAREPPAPRRSC